MGTWGPGLWSDDTAADVRACYREALEDGLSDEEATAGVLSQFAPDLADEDSAPVVWLALAVSQHLHGRLTPHVRDQALAAIDSGADLRLWDHADGRVRSRRAAVLDKIQGQLTGPQPARKQVRRPPRRVTSLAPGDVLGYRARSERVHLLAVRAVAQNRYGTYPIVRYHQPGTPPAGTLAALRDQPAGRPSHQVQPPDPWWAVSGLVMHRRGHDFADNGFEVIGHMPPPPEDEQEKLRTRINSYTAWEFWQGYLEKQDELLAARLQPANPAAHPLSPDQAGRHVWHGRGDVRTGARHAQYAASPSDVPLPSPARCPQPPENSRLDKHRSVTNSERRCAWNVEQSWRLVGSKRPPSLSAGHWPWCGIRRQSGAPAIGCRPRCLRLAPYRGQARRD